MRIGTVTMNPCVDKTYFMDALPGSGIHTVPRTTFMTGGKGHNVSRALSLLGTPCRGFTPIGGPTGQHIKEMLSSEGLDTHFVNVSGLTRTITTVTDASGRQIAYKELATELSPEDIDNIKHDFLLFLDDIDMLCLSGTLPCASIGGFYSFAVAAAKSRGLRVLLDSSGADFADGLTAVPHIIKPNSAELAAYSGCNADSVDALAAELKKLMLRGIELPIVTMGSGGALACLHGEIVKIISPAVTLVNEVGCGDSFVAGLLHGLAHGMDTETSLRLAAASGAVNAAKWEAGVVSPSEVAQLLPHAIIKPL